LIEFAACCLIDRFGVIYESEWEFMAGAQLQEANCRFVKPASTLYRVARGRRRPDFIVFDRTGRQFIVEVDPPANKLTKARKALRDVEYNAEGICCVRWNSLKNARLIALLLVEGFVL
jgi:hypothetical protein